MTDTPPEWVRRARTRYRRVVLVAIVTNDRGEQSVAHLPVWVERREVPARHARHTAPTADDAYLDELPPRLLWE